MEQSRGTRLSISEQANLLLDDPAARAKKIRLELFASMDAAVLESLGSMVKETVAEPIPTPPTAQTGSYIVASRLSRNNYEDSTKKEAIMAALQSLRGNGRALGSSGRIIRAP